jgi:hypothetical protein
MSTPAIAIFTFKALERIIRDGGTSSWALNRAHARSFPYVVCTRNAHNPDVEGPEAHGAAFVIARLKEVVVSPENPDRWLIQFAEFAPIEVAGAWKGWRNPVKYTTLEELGIDPTTLTFQPMPEPAPITPDQIEAVEEIEQTEDAPFTLTIARAKEGLANAFGVTTEAVEITIRG